jgi:hypothetical protein
MVTAIAVPIDGQARIVSSSRDKSVLVWNLDPLALSANGLVGEGESDSTALGKPFRRLTGHSHFVQVWLTAYLIRSKQNILRCIVVLYE